MRTGYKGQCVPSYRILDDRQIQEVHQSILQVLWTVGVKVAHEEGIQLLLDNGCRVLRDDIVQIPGHLVEEAIQSAPSGFTMYNRKGEEAMVLSGRNSYFGMGTDLIETWDIHSGELRSTLLKDVVNAARISDYCDQIDFIASYALPHDVPTNTMYIECVRAQLENSCKPIFFTGGGREDLEFMYEMFVAVAGSEEALRAKPIGIHYSEPTPPLVHSFGAVSKLFFCADHQFPINYPPFCSMGGSAPITLAGGLVQGLAEALSGLTLHQLRRKGSPITGGVTVAPLDMRTSAFSYGAPEFRVTNSAFSDMYHYYGLPMWSTVGSDAIVMDEQAAMEHSFSTMMSLLDGANLIHDVGYMGQGLIGNPAFLVMCNEIISYARRIMSGFEFSRELVGLDTILAVGPGGDYLSQDHTLKYYKTEQWRPQTLNRLIPDVWKERGRKTFGQVVTEKTLEILDTYKPEPLPDSVRQELADISVRAEKELKGKLFRS